MATKIMKDLIQIFNSSVSAVLPKNLIRNSIKFNPKDDVLEICGKKYNVKNRDVYVVGMGKAVQPMARETESILGRKIKDGIVSIPVGSLKKECDGGCKAKGAVKYIEGAKNNLPDSNAESTAKKIMDLAKKLSTNDILIVLISGGGSALFPLPINPIKLEEKTKLIKNLANAGADITELNAVRKKISASKGGKLALQAQPADVVSLILSDIVGDPLDLIASAPTVENKDDYKKAHDVLVKYKVYNDLPVSIKKVLQEKEKPIPWPKDKVFNNIIGSNKLSLEAAMKEAINLKYTAITLSNEVTGNIKVVKNEYVRLTKLICNYLDGKISKNEAMKIYSDLEIPNLKPNILDSHCEMEKGGNVCLLFGGEITVEVRGKGLGGRNQQLALEYSYGLQSITEDIKNFDINFLSAGTDGIDGPTDAAGGIGYKDLLPEANRNAINLLDYLNRNDSYNFYKKFQNGKYHVITGHTFTNVMDIHVILISKK